MKRFEIPSGKEKPSWGGLFGAMSAAYVFWDPYQNAASWAEWLWTGLAFALFFILAALGAIYWSQQRIMQRICLALALLAATFTAYRPSGVVFFIFVAAFGPLAAGGDLAKSAAIVFGAALSLLGTWWLLWPPSLMPYVMASQCVLIGGAITVVIRQQIALRMNLKTAERERIARDLHDILGHTLSVVILKSELASRLLEHDTQRAKAEIEEVERISRKALSEVREAISGYHDANLRAEFTHAKTTLETAGIIVESEYEPVDLPIAHERVLALVLREAVTNVLRHAHAKRFRLALKQIGTTCRLEIHDDGRGGTHREGMGMRGIRDRVAAIGGQVSWGTGPGTALTITLPSTAGEAQ